MMLPVESVFARCLPLLMVEPWVEQHLYNGCPTSRYRQQTAATGCAMPQVVFGACQHHRGVLRVEKLFVERN